MDSNKVYFGIDPDDNSDNDDDFDLSEPELACPACGEENYEYIGEAYDDEEWIGSSYRCEECGHEFVAWE